MVSFIVSTRKRVTSLEEHPELREQRGREPTPREAALLRYNAGMMGMKDKIAVARDSLLSSTKASEVRDFETASDFSRINQALRMIGYYSRMAYEGLRVLENEDSREKAEKVA